MMWWERVRARMPLPDEHFGLIHGKAGVIHLADGSKSGFPGQRQRIVFGLEAQLRAGMEGQND